MSEIPRAPTCKWCVYAMQCKKRTQLQPHFLKISTGSWKGSSSIIPHQEQAGVLHFCALRCCCCMCVQRRTPPPIILQGNYSAGLCRSAVSAHTTHSLFRLGVALLYFKPHLHIWWRAHHQGVTLFAKPYNFIRRVIRRTGTKRAASGTWADCVCVCRRCSLAHMRAHIHAERSRSSSPKALRSMRWGRRKTLRLDENELDF